MIFLDAQASLAPTTVRPYVPDTFCQGLWDLKKLWDGIVVADIVADKKCDQYGVGHGGRYGGTQGYRQGGRHGGPTYKTRKKVADMELDMVPIWR